MIPTDQATQSTSVALHDPELRNMTCREPEAGMDILLLACEHQGLAANQNNRGIAYYHDCVAMRRNGASCLAGPSDHPLSAAAIALVTDTWHQCAVDEALVVADDASLAVDAQLSSMSGINGYVFKVRGEILDRTTVFLVCFKGPFFSKAMLSP